MGDWFFKEREDVSILYHLFPCLSSDKKNSVWVSVHFLYGLCSEHFTSYVLGWHRQHLENMVEKMATETFCYQEEKNCILPFKEYLVLDFLVSFCSSAEL